MLDKDGLVTTWNAGAEKITGYSADAILGKSYTHFYLPEAPGRTKPSDLLHQA